MDTLKQMQVDAFISRIIVYESAVSLQMVANLFKWPPLVLLIVPTTIQSYTALYPQTQSVDLILKIVSVLLIGLSSLLKLWDQAKGYDVSIQKFKQTHDSLSNIINEIDLTIAKSNINSLNRVDSVTSVDSGNLLNAYDVIGANMKSIETIITKFDAIRKEMPLVPKNIFEKYYGTNNINDIKNLNELLNYRERRLLPQSRYILTVNPNFVYTLA